MTYREILNMLNRLPNFSEPAGGLAPEDRSWLCDLRLRFAAGEVPSVQDEQRLCRIMREYEA